MTPEKNDKKLTRWLLAATIALLLLVLGLQLWQMFGRRTYGDHGALAPDSANGPAVPQSAGESLTPAAVSPGKAAMIEDVRALNAGLSAGDLAKLSAQELEQLYETGAPGLPIGVSAAAQAAEEYAGTLAVDSVTSETDPELDESPAHYDVELHHPALGDFEYKIDAYTGQVLEGAPDILRSGQTADAPQAVPGDAGEEAATQAAFTHAGASASGGFIGEEAAKNAALAHAGISAADAGYVKCELDEDDGLWVYEIEFRAESVEYDYEISAADGTVIKAEQDR